MECHAGKVGAGKMRGFEASMRDFESEKTGDVKARVMVRFDAGDGRTAGVGVLEEESTETANIEQRAARATME